MNVIKTIYFDITSYRSSFRYRVSKNSLDKEKFEYLHSVLIKWAHFFVGDRGVFKVFIYKKNIKKYCFELQLLT